jgi:hypothetical protein
LFFVSPCLVLSVASWGSVSLAVFFFIVRMEISLFLWKISFLYPTANSFYAGLAEQAPGQLSFSGFFVVMCVMDLELFYAVQVCWSGQFGLWWLLSEAAIWDACKRWTQQSLKQYKLSAQSSCTTKELHCGLGLHSTSSSYSRREAALGMYLLPCWRLDVLLQLCYF